MDMQNHQLHQKLKRQAQRASIQLSTAAAVANTFTTNTAKLPLETVKLLIASVSLRPNLWNRSSNGHKRSDINALWQQVSQEVNLPANICRIKWGHLRDNFRKVFIRNTLSTESPTTWRFYNDMRFMETAVAENVMRHHKLRTQFLHWQGLYSVDQQQNISTSSTADLNQDYYRFIPNELNFSELSAFIQNKDLTMKQNIKLERFDSEAKFQDQDKISVLNSICQNEKPNNSTDIPNDDIRIDNNNVTDGDEEQFDDDATSVEDNYQISIRNENFSFENNTKINVQGIKTENLHANLDEHDSDRLFLLSLLPYLGRVKEQRKLYVRQKLQDVLIQEFG